MTTTARILAALALLAFGALASLVVDWERKSEIHGLVGPLELPRDNPTQPRERQ